jgi:hypothetical protein
MMPSQDREAIKRQYGTLFVSISAGITVTVHLIAK